MWGKDMAEPITLQELAGASENAQSFDSFLNADATTTVPRRSASDINTLDYYRDYLHGLELVYSQQSGTVTVNGVETKTVTQAVQDAINDNASVFKGDKGNTGTIDVGTTTTGAAGSAVIVTASGTPTARVFNFTIPRGDKGETGNLPNVYSDTTLEAPNIHITSSGVFKRSNDPLNASTRKVGTAAGNLVERDANGYPSNTNAIGVGQTWQNMTASRTANVAYQNTTNRPVQYMVGANSVDGVEISPNGTTWSGIVSGGSADGVKVSPILPAGWYIRAKSVTGNSLYSWWELK